MQFIAINSGNENGGVSCSSSAQGTSADSAGEDGSGSDAKSPSAGPAPGNTILNSGVDGVFSE